MRNLGKFLILSASILASSAVVPFETAGASTIAASTTKMVSTSFKITSTTSLRSNPGTSFKAILSLPKNQKVVSSERKGSWYKVSLKISIKGKTLSKVGWVNGACLKEDVQYTTTPLAYYFTKYPAKLYSTPDTKKKEVYKVSRNTGFSSSQKVINSIGQTWYRVSFQGKILFVKNTDVNSRAFSSFASTRFTANVASGLYASYGYSHKKLLSLPKGTIVTSTKKIGEWYGVTLNGVSGYVYMKDFTKNNDVTYFDMKETIFFTNKTANLYATPDSSKKEVTSIPANNGFSSTKKALNSLNETWFQVSLGDQQLYVKSTDVTSKTVESLSQTAFKAKIDANLYLSYGSVYMKLGVIPKDTFITSNSRIGDWYNVSFNGMSGYVNINDFEISENQIAATTFLTMSDINLTSEPEESSSILTAIPNSKIVLATAKTSNGWYKVTFGGQTGYVTVNSLKQVKTGDPITNRDGYQFIDLRTQSAVTAQQIDDYIAAYVNAKGKESVLTGKGQVFIDAGKANGVNALYLAAHAIHESGFGTSALAWGKNNLFGFGAYDTTPYMAAYRFASVDLCIDYIAREIKTTYLNSTYKYYNGAYLGFRTNDLSDQRIASNSEGMNYFYATDPNWGTKIASHMEKILHYDKTYYSQAAIDTVYPVRPTIPDGSDVFPANIQATAITDLTLNSSKGTHDSVTKITKGSSFTLLEKTNDYWVKVMFNNEIYWTDSIIFSKYKNYMSVLNLGRANDKPNVRTAPTTATADNIMLQLNLNDYVSIVLNSDGTPAMDSSKTWYNIQLADGRTGWVSAQYLTRELK